ncbi:stage III sporulation protein SpoIIIAB [Gracilibacillus alcaliphilus]|uniref:stage III sporulation protein SpoIIIAB n=1 Tax=Gracilibacillus alcaliphilus TaxID=1401441 RepID=UPI00195A3642|nr:stage III sporulation protein SpoIIIAB [Gracilibacillus alcaliphilus]MBM7675056.1 stage III sporulation protein AB [Gracilibacillus alcaliphilus]
MLKLIFSIIIVASLTWLGHEYAMKLANRPRYIRIWKHALQILEAEIVYSHETIKEAMYRVYHQIEPPVNQLFQCVADNIQPDKEELYPIWQEQLDLFGRSYALNNQDIDILQQFGRTLGQHDVIQQQKYIRLAIQHLERSLEEADQQKLRYGNMSRSIGFLVGVFIVLLLL